MFTDEFLDNLPEDPHEATARLCGEFKTISGQISQKHNT